MNPSRAAVASTVVLGLLTVAAGRQIAMRVEVAPAETDFGRNMTAVSIFVAPEDRGVLGGDVMVWAELSNNEERVARKGWAIKIDDPGAPIRIEAEWPVGEYVLRVDIEGAQGRSYGVWWGEVDLTFPSPSPAPSPLPVPVPVPVPDGTSVSAGDEPQRSAAATGTAPAAEAAAVTATEAAAVTATAAAAETETVAEAATETAAATATEAATEAAAEAAAGTAAATATAAGTEAAAEAAAETATTAEAEAAADTAAGTETVAAADSAAGTETASVPTPMPVANPAPVEEDAADELEPTPIPVETRVAEPDPPVEPASGGREPLADWASTSRDSGELTIAVIRDGEPVLDLAASDLRVRVGRKEIPVIEIGGADVAPVLLGIAIDLAPESAGDLPWIGRLVAQLAERAAGDRGQAFVTTTDGASTGWGIDTETTADYVVAYETRAETGLSSLVERSLAAFEGRRGRAALLVVTDGRGSRPRDNLRDALRAAETSGVPVYVIGIWHDRFGQGLRKDLRRITVSSGGGSFYIQGAGQIDDVLHRYGGVLDGMYAVRVDAPVGTLGIEVVVADASVRASTAVR